jgi:hypothetical protein
MKMNKYLLMGLLFVVTALLMLLGKGSEAAGFVMANTAVVSLTEAEKEGLSDEQQKLVLAMKKQAAQWQEDYRKGLLTKTEFEAAIAGIDVGLSKAEAKALQDQLSEMKGILETQGTALQTIQLNSQAPAAKETLLSVVTKNIEGIKGSTKKGKDFEFEVKADTLRASVVGNASALEVNEIGQLAHRQLTVYDIFRKVPVPKDRNGVIRYVDWDEATVVRAAAAIAEGGTFPASTAKWATYTLSLEKIGDSIPMSEEFMYDASLFAAELENFLKVNMAIKVDTDLVAANGTSPNINGLLNQIDAYTAANSGITDASLYDLLVKVRESITKPYGSKYSPNVALMNITDINKMKLKKDANNNYVLPPFYDKAGNVVDGITVIECNSITENTMVVGDSRYGAIYEETGVAVTTGYATGDFESDMMTLKGRRRMNLLVRKADKTGWKKVTSISAALTTLATAPA